MTLAASRPRLPRTVFALGTVSFLTDLGSEMILPLLPAFLAEIGGSKQQLGLLQGLSEFIVAGMKLASGWLSDLQRRRKPWIVIGYGLSTLVRPLMSLVTTPWQVMLVRSADRSGKGLRTAPRDALLADSVPADRRGEAFGVQRGMDHAGALCGSLLAALLLWFGCEQRTVFAAALVPGLFSVLVLVLFVRESKHADAIADEGTPAAPVRTVLPFLGVVALAAAGSAVDLFLLARAQELGVPVASLPLLWAVLHVARAGLSHPLGALSDRLGRRRVIGCGLLAHACVMVGFAYAEESFWMWPLFAVHGLHAAFTEGAERGYVADLTGSGRRGRSFGIYHAVQGVAAFVGPLLIGTVWDQVGARSALLCAGGATVLALVLLPFVARARQRAAP